ncbi:Uncharacterised protein [uncultured archaeon]|nr:Uncharacterised protein [uncultured archaeon]
MTNNLLEGMKIGYRLIEMPTGTSPNYGLEINVEILDSKAPSKSEDLLLGMMDGAKMLDEKANQVAIGYSIIRAMQQQLPDAGDGYFKEHPGNKGSKHIVAQFYFPVPEKPISEVFETLQRIIDKHKYNLNFE